VSGVFGVKGEVRVHLHNRESTFLGVERAVVLIAPTGARYGASLRCRAGAGKRVLGRLSEVVGREAAAALKDFRIAVKHSELPALEDGEFYVWRVIGLPVFTDQGEVGVVSEVHASGPLDIFEIKTSEGVFFVPAQKDRLTVDLEAGQVRVLAEALVDG